VSREVRAVPRCSLLFDEVALVEVARHAARCSSRLQNVRSSAPEMRE
jgi:hypothetical protein